MINISTESIDAANRSNASNNIPAFQPVVGLKPFTPQGLKPTDKLAAQSSLKPSSADIDAAVKKINSFVSASAQSVEFVLDQESNRTVVKVIDTETKRVLRQFPNEEVLAMSKTLDKLQGLMVKQTA